MHTRSWLTFHSVLATKRIWRKESLKRRIEAEKVGTYSFDWISTKTLLRFVAFVLRRENRTTMGQPSLFFLSFFSLSLPFPSVFKEESLPPLCVPPLLARRERGNYTDFLSFVGEGKRLQASLVISCRLAIAGFRSLSPGSLGIISGKLFRGSSWSTFG